MLFQKVIYGNIVNKVINGNIVNMMLKITEHPIYNNIILVFIEFIEENLKLKQVYNSLFYYDYCVIYNNILELSERTSYKSRAE